MPKKMYPSLCPRRLPSDDVKIHVLQAAKPSTFATLVNRIIAGEISYHRTTPSPDYRITDGIVT